MKCRYCNSDIEGNQSPLIDGTYICPSNCKSYPLSFKNEINSIILERQKLKEKKFIASDKLDRPLYVSYQNCDHSGNKTICILCSPH